MNTIKLLKRIQAVAIEGDNTKTLHEILRAIDECEEEERMMGEEYLKQ